MARKAIQCDLKKHKVAKLFYVLIGPYYIIRNTGYGSYFVKKLYNTDSPEIKSIAHDLYPLLQSIKPCESIDSIDIRYLDQSYDPLVNPLKKSLHIELYNDK